MDKISFGCRKTTQQYKTIFSDVKQYAQGYKYVDPRRINHVTNLQILSKIIDFYRKIFK